MLGSEPRDSGSNPLWTTDSRCVAAGGTNRPVEEVQDTEREVGEDNSFAPLHRYNANRVIA